MTIDDMRKRIEEIDEGLEANRYALNTKGLSAVWRSMTEKINRRLETEKASLEQDIEDRIHENELEASEMGNIVRKIPGGSDE